MKIGNGKSNSRSTRKDFKLKDGDQVYRILPGLGDLADTNRWSMHYAVHWGYCTSDGKKKPFVSPEKKNRETKMIEVSDAAKERLETLKGKLEEAKKSGNKPVLDKLNPLVGREGLYNLDANHYLNVIDAQGNIGVLKIRHKCKVALEALIKKLESTGTYPLSPEDGRYFVFTRSGMGNETSFSVNILTEEFEVAGVGKVKRDKVHALTPDIINRLENEAGKLDQLFPRFTAEQVQKIVDTSDLMTGKSSYLDELFDRSAHNADNTPTEAPKTTPTVATEAPKAAETVEPAAAQAAPQQAAPAVEPIKVSTAKAGVVKSTSPSTPVTEMSDADFLDALNSGAL